MVTSDAEWIKIYLKAVKDIVNEESNEVESK